MRVYGVQAVNLEFAVGITDADLKCLRGSDLDSVNLNACQGYASRKYYLLFNAAPS